MNPAPEEPLPSALSRVEDLWIPRDTIVIRAENTIFQVPRAVLAAQSTVFREMLSFPQPSTPETELIDGSPVVRLHDSAKDVEVFLRAIFDASYFEPAPAQTEILSHKYDVNFLYRRALDHLAKAGWYSLTYDEIPVFDMPLTPNSGPMGPLSIAAVASEVGALWLLPWAYLRVAGCKSVHLLPLIDGEFQTHVRRCIVAQEQLVRESVAVNRFLLQNDQCTTDRCRENRLYYSKESLDFIERGFGTCGLDPFDEWSSERLEEIGDELCPACRALSTERTKLALTRSYEKLPGTFGLP
ncbi:hypothetical protein B0H16DRAFT_1630326 [Mycena metata]|uniref:BTB domain-containing protein n=1 Tax=Mycena metata TaxID=1033252 RepID=A0AAD7H1M0_9AGAR|nr:hypothetical protein B0H16DRAFT_1630326 [Mycena metata]